MMMPTQFTSNPSERVDMQKLGTVVENAVRSISAKTSLAENEVLDILEKVRVTMVGELRRAVEILEARGMIQAVDESRLSAAIEEAIEEISNATDLNTDEITEVFTKEEGASLEHIVFRLRARSVLDRANHV